MYANIIQNIFVEFYIHEPILYVFRTFSKIIFFLIVVCKRKSCIFAKYIKHNKTLNYTFHKYVHDAGIVKSDLNGFWLCRLIQGNIRILFEQSEYEIKKGAVFVLQEGVRFKWLSNSPDMELEVLSFHVQLMNIVYSLLGAEADFGSLKVDFWCNHRMKKPFSRLLTLDYESLRTAVQHPALTARNKMVTAGLVHLLLILYNAADSNTDVSHYDNGKRSRLILCHYYELLGEYVTSGMRNIPFYADKLCISARYLSRICKAETGRTPKEILHQFLIGEIKNALLTSEQSNQQIADRFGFPDQSSFGQFFKRQESMSPSEFRKRYR